MSHHTVGVDISKTHLGPSCSNGKNCQVYQRAGWVQGTGRLDQPADSLPGLRIHRALVAIRCNPDLSREHHQLRVKGKPPKVAITAFMRKLVILANTLIKQNRLWSPDPPIRK